MIYFPLLQFWIDLVFFQLVSNKLLCRNDFNLNDPVDLWHKKAGSITAKPTYCYRKNTCPLRFPEYKSICCQNGAVQLDLPKQPEGPNKYIIISALY